MPQNKKKGGGKPKRKHPSAASAAAASTANQENTAAAAPAQAPKVAPAKSPEELEAENICKNFTDFANAAETPSPVRLVEEYNELCSKMPRSVKEPWKYHENCGASVWEMVDVLNKNFDKYKTEAATALTLPIETLWNLIDNLYAGFDFTRNNSKLKAILLHENGPESSLIKLIFDSLIACDEEIVVNDFLDETKSSKSAEDEKSLYDLLQFLDRIGFDQIPQPFLDKTTKALEFGLNSVSKEGKTLKNIDYYLLNLISHLTSFIAKDENGFRICKDVLEKCFQSCSEVFSKYEREGSIKPAIAQRFLDLALFLAAKEENPAKKDKYLENPQVVKAAKIVYQDFSPTISRLQGDVYKNVIANFQALGFVKNETLFGDENNKSKCVFLIHKDGRKVKIELEGVCKWTSDGKTPLMSADIVITTFKEEKVTGIYPIEVDGPSHFFKFCKNDTIDIFFENGKTIRREEVAKGLGFVQDNRLVLDYPKGHFGEKRKLLSNFVVKIVEAQATQINRVEKKQAATAAAASQPQPAPTPEPAAAQPAPTAKPAVKTDQEPEAATKSEPTQEPQAAEATPPKIKDFSFWFNKMLAKKPNQRDLDMVLDSLAETPEAELQKLKIEKYYLDEVLKKISSGNSNQWLKILAQSLNIEGFDCSSKEMLELPEEPTKEDIINNLESCINSKDGFHIFLRNPKLIPTVAKVGIEHEEKVYHLIKKIIYYCKDKKDKESVDLFNLALSHQDLMATISNEWSKSANLLLKILLNNKVDKKEFSENNNDQETNLGLLFQSKNPFIQNNPAVQNDLGYCHQNHFYSKNHQENNRKALEYFNLAAKQGYAKAQTNLGHSYENGIGVPKDEARAAELYKLAANQGYPPAQTKLGILYGLGAGVNKDEKEAAKFYRLAADQGCEYAQLRLGQYYQHGIGVDKDDAAAFQLFELAADQGNAEAQVNLGIYYFKGGIGFDQNQKEAVRLFELAAKQDNSEGLVNLAMCYSEGVGGLPKDSQKAVQLLQSAAKQGNPKAQVKLGICYENNVGVEEEKLDEKARLKKAIKLYELAVAKGNADAQFNLGVCYQNNIVPEAKKLNDEARLERAVNLYQLAVNQGHAEAQFALGFCYANIFSDKDHLKEAIKLYKSAAEQGHAKAQYTLAIHYKNNEVDENLDDEARSEEVRKLLESAAENGLSEAQNLLGLFYLQENTQDFTKAVKFLKLAAEQGSAEAQLNLGICYENNAGVEKGLDEEARLKKAIELYESAVAKGNSDAEFCLGICYFKGVGVNVDDSKADELFQSSLQKGNSDAAINLGLLYLKKDGKFYNEKQALNYFRLAAKYDNADGLFHLGLCSLNGTGVKKDPNEALRLLKLAAEKGSHEATEKLAELKEEGQAHLANAAPSSKEVKGVSAKKAAEKKQQGQEKSS